MRLLKILVVLLVAAFLALVGYAYLGDMAPRQQEMRKPVSLDTGRAAPATPAATTTTTAAPAETDAAAPADAAADTAPAEPAEAADGTDANAQQ